MNYSRGDIILADLPFTDLSRSKVRPALVVQSDHNNARLDDVIFALITRTVSRATIEPTQLLIDVATPTGRASGLLHTSAIKCEHLVTLHKSFIKRVIGRLPSQLLNQVDECLKAALDLL
ncbi:MAG: type II toxin-antitoxin system PemK/MazF family toxin [Planctomycetia bacterium]|jgi:mRNA interferase MazF|nr:type II toxin-antitoxin system PemK/MazF family toxin [Planctomycetia bacterium]